MGTNKRYADNIDARRGGLAESATASGRPPALATSSWSPPWPPIKISDVEWIIMRDSKVEPVGVICCLKLGPRQETFYRVVTWAPTSAGRQLVGYFDTLSKADQSLKFDPYQPKMPNPQTSTGH